jgi:hypothetical protein
MLKKLLPYVLGLTIAACGPSPANLEQETEIEFVNHSFNELSLGEENLINHFLDELNPKFTNGLEKIVFSPTKDSPFEQNPGWLAFYQPNNITFPREKFPDITKNAWAFRNTLLHELGHHVDFKYVSDELMEGFETGTPIFGQNENEDFANMFQIYHTQGSLLNLELHYPSGQNSDVRQKYNFLKQHVFDGQDSTDLNSNVALSELGGNLHRDSAFYTDSPHHSLDKLYAATEFSNGLYERFQHVEDWHLDDLHFEKYEQMLDEFSGLVDNDVAITRNYLWGYENFLKHRGEFEKALAISRDLIERETVFEYKMIHTLDTIEFHKKLGNDKDAQELADSMMESFPNTYWSQKAQESLAQ